jgi:hypothetical protein
MAPPEEEASATYFARPKILFFDLQTCLTSRS